MNTTAPATSGLEEVQRLFLRHAAVLRGFILGLLPDPHRAEDVFQELFLTLSRKADEFRPGSNFLAWARSIARLKVLEQCRASSSGPHLLEPDTLEAVVLDAPEVEDHWKERREALAQCLQQLAPRAREILELRYSEAFLSPPEIASKLSWSVNAVHVALSRARKFLQECTRRRLSQMES
ncbi:MAG: sigma-70 family RNA polymerase sigma factor [Gemmataceae bacterium]